MTSNVRVAVRHIHLWLGLIIGGLFALAGLTGSALVFYPELDAALSPALRAAPPGARPASWQAVYDTLRREYPRRAGAWRIEVRPSGGAIPVRYYRPRETQGRDFAPLLVWIDPVRLTTIRSAFWGGTIFTWVYDLHYRLLLDRPGGTIMGVAGIIMMCLLVSGLWAWWPRHGGWRRAIHLKRAAPPIRGLYDLHKLTGLAGLLVLLVVTATGVMLSLPDQVRPLLRRVSVLYGAPAFSVRPVGDPLPLDIMIRRAERRFPDGRLAWIETPANSRGALRINLARPGEPSRRFPRTNVWLDPHTGRILSVRDGRDEKAGDTVLNWLHPLHGGEAFGWVGRLLVFIGGLLPATLFVTGLLRWTQRRRHWRRRHGRPLHKI